MKKIFVLVFSFSLFFSCSTGTGDISDDKILGSWIWIETSGGFAGTTETPESTGDVVRLEISANSIKRFVNGELELNRSYRISRRKSMIYDDEREMIIYTNGFRQIYVTAGNELFLTDDCYDCFQSRYQEE